MSSLLNIQVYIYECLLPFSLLDVQYTKYSIVYVWMPFAIQSTECSDHSKCLFCHSEIMKWHNKHKHWKCELMQQSNSEIETYSIIILNIEPQSQSTHQFTRHSTLKLGFSDSFSSLVCVQWPSSVVLWCCGLGREGSSPILACWKP
jgi:hypothetical protein